MSLRKRGLIIDNSDVSQAIYANVDIVSNATTANLISGRVIKQGFIQVAAAGAINATNFTSTATSATTFILPNSINLIGIDAYMRGSTPSILGEKITPVGSPGINIQVKFFPSINALISTNIVLINIPAGVSKTSISLNYNLTAGNILAVDMAKPAGTVTNFGKGLILYFKYY